MLYLDIAVMWNSKLGSCPILCENGNVRIDPFWMLYLVSSLIVPVGGVRFWPELAVKNNLDCKTTCMMKKISSLTTSLLTK